MKQPSREGRFRITLLLSGALCAGMTGCEPKPAPKTVDDPVENEAAALVDRDKDYDNNQFIPGVGYYHAPYHNFFPHPWNYYLGGRGYYRGGSWTEDSVPTAWVNRSKPDPLRSGFSSGSSGSGYRGSGFSSEGGSSSGGSHGSGFHAGGFGSHGSSGS